MARRIQKKRDASLDFLRVIAALAVVWLHVSGDVVGTNPDIHQLYWWAGNIVDSLTRWCVAVFVMISGSLLLNKPSNKEPSAFYRSSLPRILIFLAFWTLFYFLLREWAGDQPSIFRIAGDVLTAEWPVIGIGITATLAFVLSALSAALFAVVPGVNRTVT